MKRFIIGLCRLWFILILIPVVILGIGPLILLRFLEKKPLLTPLHVTPAPIEAKVEETFASLRFFQNFVDKGWRN